VHNAFRPLCLLIFTICKSKFFTEILEAEALRAELHKTTPRRYGNLVRNLTKAQVTNRDNWYGYRLEFEGDDPRGTPYQRIVNVLNFGSSTIKGTRFISKAIRKPKGIDSRIAKRFEDIANDLGN